MFLLITEHKYIISCFSQKDQLAKNGEALASVCSVTLTKRGVALVPIFNWLITVGMQSKFHSGRVAGVHQVIVSPLRFCAFI